MKPIRRFFKEVDRMLRRQLQGYKTVHGLTPACDGCKAHRCCEQLIWAYPGEIYNIVDYIRKKDVAVDERLKTWLEKYLELPLEAQAHEADYFQARLMCPFYVDGRCSIYPARPLSCRTYFALEDDEGPCNGTVGEGQVTLLDKTYYHERWMERDPRLPVLLPMAVAAVLWEDRFPEVAEMLKNRSVQVVMARAAIHTHLGE